MKAKEFLESKGIDTLTVPGFKTQNANGSQTFWTAFQILEEYAQSCIDNSVRLCNCSEEDYIGFTSINCCNTCGQPQEEFWINRQESNTDSHIKISKSKGDFRDMDNFESQSEYFGKSNTYNKAEPCKHEGQEIPSKTIVCKYCGEIETTTSVSIVP